MAPRPSWCAGPATATTSSELEPGIRERQDESGAPPGFADAVAWVERAPAGAPATWRIVFAVADTDATARRAVALGGEVRVEPYDAGPVRAAVLVDDQGAEFTMNHFDPSLL